MCKGYLMGLGHVNFTGTNYHLEHLLSKMVKSKGYLVDTHSRLLELERKVEVLNQLIIHSYKHEVYYTLL